MLIYFGKKNKPIPLYLLKINNLFLKFLNSCNMEIRNSFDPNEKRIQLIVTSNLLNNYFPNFSGMIKNSSKRLDLTEDQLRVEKTGKNTAIISFPLPVDSQVMKVDEQKMAVSMNPLSMEILNDSINRFCNAALRKTLKTTEFLPIFGYPIEDLKEDVKEAVKNKRNFCIIKDYQEYLDFSNSKESPKYCFTQVIAEYMSDLWAEAVLLILDDKIEDLRKLVEPLYKKTEWI